MGVVTLHDLHLAIVAGNGTIGESLQVNKPVVFGTAFPIAPGLFMTANHVLTDALADAGTDGVVALFRKGPTQIESGPVTQHEAIPSLDLALLACPHFKRLEPLPADFTPLDIFVPVSAAGYPYAVDSERLSFVPRGFAGHVVTRRELYHLPAQPPGYEVSFPAPRGLSGAPLIVRDRIAGARCVGTIIENWKYASGDFIAGIAIASEAFLSIESKLLGRPLAHLWSRDRQALRPPTPVRNPLMVPFDASIEDWPDDGEANG